jgi:cytochrome c-type biogenesis protein CcsB
MFGFGGLSDELLRVALIAYTGALVGHTVQHAYGRAVTGARVPPVARQPVPVGAGSGGPLAPVGVEVGQPGRQAPLWRGAERAGRAARIAAVVGVAAQAACLAVRGTAAGRVPWGNMYEFVLVATLVGVAAWLVVAARRRLWHLGGYVMLAVVVLLGVDGAELYVPAGPLVPALNSYWLKIHVVAAATATGLLLVGFVVAVLFLVRQAYDTRATAGREPVFPTSLGPRLPAAAVLDRLVFRLHATAFPVWTFAVMTGAIWAESAWGSYWSWDPKETWALISWLCYAGYLHARATGGAVRRRSAWIAVAGWATMLVNLFVVNLFVSGLHSYAGL